MKSFRAIFIALLISMITVSAYGATPRWIPLYMDGDETIYIDEANFSSNLNTRTLDEPYQVVYWIRQETLRPGSYLEYRTILEASKEQGVIRYRTLQSRYVGEGETITSVNYSGWERLAPGEPVARVFQEVWVYDQIKDDKKQRKLLEETDDSTLEMIKK